MVDPSAAALSMVMTFPEPVALLMLTDGPVWPSIEVMPPPPPPPRQSSQIKVPAPSLSFRHWSAEPTESGNVSV